MVSKDLRINRANFTTIFTTGRRFHGRFMTIVAKLDCQPGVTVVVSKKVAKRAVDRNRLKRQIYGAVVSWQSNDQLSGAVIFLLKPTAATATKIDLGQEVVSLLAQTKETR